MMKILIALISVILVICAALLEWAATGQFYWVPAAVAIAIGSWIMWWIAGNLIEAIDWMTRWES